MTATQAKRLAKITEAGTLTVLYLNAADHWLRAQGLITWTAERLAKPAGKSDFLYRLIAIGA